MKFATLTRTLFITCTIAFTAALTLLVLHRSDTPVVLGRYSLSLVFLIAVLVCVYAAVSYLYLRGWRRFGEAYLFIAANLLSLVILLVAVNIAAHTVTFFTGSSLTSLSSAAEDALVLEQERVHAELIGLNQDEFLAFRSEQGREKNWQYEPWVGFRETPRDGRYINVSPEGFRRTTASPDNPRHWIFLLGGSTTFGYGVTDDQTIASYLQARLTQTYGGNTFGVRNFGRAYYYSSQEYVLLWRLLEQGLKPSVVIFIDGDNEPQTSPYYVNEMRVMFDRYQEESMGGRPVGNLLAELAISAPIYPYLRRLYLERLNRAGESATKSAQPLARLRPGTTPSDIAAQYEANNEAIRLLAARHNVVPFFVVQPMPGYKNEHATHVFMKEPLIPFSTDVLALLDASTSKHPQRLNLTSLLAGYQKQPFVDRLHYTPEVHQLIANAIADQTAPVLNTMAGSPDSGR